MPMAINTKAMVAAKLLLTKIYTMHAWQMLVGMRCLLEINRKDRAKTEMKNMENIREEVANRSEIYRKARSSWLAQVYSVIGIILIILNPERATTIAVIWGVFILQREIVLSDLNHERLHAIARLERILDR